MPGGLQSFPGDINVQGNIFCAGSISGPGGLAITGQILAPDGAAAVPSYAFALEPTMGMFRRGNNRLGISAGGTQGIEVASGGLLLSTGGQVSWSSGGFGTTIDLSLFQDAADIMAQRRGTNAQIFRCYKTTAGTAWIGFDTVDAAAPIIKSTFAMANNAAAAAGTLNNAPAAGNPTKWIPISDNGTIRNIPAW